MKKKLDSFYLEYMGWIKTKTISRYCPFNSCYIGLSYRILGRQLRKILEGL
jgi:hypothetical protein